MLIRKKFFVNLNIQKMGLHADNHVVLGSEEGEMTQNIRYRKLHKIFIFG